MYAIMYPIAVFVMFYMERQLTVTGAALCIICNIILCFKYYGLYPESLPQIISQLIFAIITCSILITVTFIHVKQSEESIGEVRNSLETSERVSGEITQLALELTEKFEVAKHDAADTVSAAETSVKAVDEIAASVRLTAENVETQTMLTSDIQGNLEQTGIATADMKEASEDTSRAVSEGMELMEKLSGQSELTAELNRNSQESTMELNNRIGEVGAIIGEIVNISSKTNLLALNASIEAARAGEAGKGFAVVAEEIRQLSELTKLSAEKITAIISKLTENAKEASDNMPQSIEATARQNEMIDDTREQISIIESKNTAQMELMNTISVQVEDILRSISGMMDSISNLSATSEEVAAASENCNTLMGDSMESMNRLNGKLDEIHFIATKLEEVAKG